MREATQEEKEHLEKATRFDLPKEMRENNIKIGEIYVGGDTSFKTLFQIILKILDNKKMMSYLSALERNHLVGKGVVGYAG